MAPQPAPRWRAAPQPAPRRRAVLCLVPVLQLASKVWGSTQVIAASTWGPGSTLDDSVSDGASVLDVTAGLMPGGSLPLDIAGPDAAEQHCASSEPEDAAASTEVLAGLSSLDGAGPDAADAEHRD